MSATQEPPPSRCRRRRRLLWIRSRLMIRVSLSILPRISSHHSSVMGRCYSGSPTLSYFVARSMKSPRQTPGGSFHLIKPPRHPPPAGWCFRTTMSPRRLRPRPRSCPAAAAANRADATMPSNAVGGGNDEKVSTTTNDDEGEDEDEGEDAANYINNSGLYLDEETYLQAEDRLLRPDGSLDLDNGDGGGVVHRRQRGEENSGSSSSSNGSSNRGGGRRRMSRPRTTIRRYRESRIRRTELPRRACFPRRLAIPT